MSSTSLWGDTQYVPLADEPSDSTVLQHSELPRPPSPQNVLSPSQSARARTTTRQPTAPALFSNQMRAPSSAQLLLSMVPTSPPLPARPPKRDLLLDEDYEDDDEEDTTQGHFQPVDEEKPDVGASFFGLGDEFEGGEYQFYEERVEQGSKEVISGWRKFPMYVLFVLMALANGALLGYSMYQLTQHQRTADKSEIHCNAQGWAQHRPIALQFIGDPETLRCTWNAINSVIRMCCSMAGMMLAFVPMYGVVQNRRVVVVASIALSTVVSTGYFISMMMDANDVRVSTNWCLGRGQNAKGDWLSDVVWKPKPAEPPLCLNQQYDLTCICDTIGLFAWAGMAFFLFQFDRSSQKRKLIPTPTAEAPV